MNINSEILMIDLADEGDEDDDHPCSGMVISGQILGIFTMSWL
jgi:hypothetical protein